MVILMEKDTLIKEINICIDNIEYMIKNNCDIIKIKEHKKRLDELLEEFYDLLK